MPPKLQNRLLIAPLPVWHATRLLPIPDVASYTPADEPRIQLAFANAKLLFDRELELYNNPTKAAEKSRSAPSSSERKFISTVLKSGTTTDKVSAIILMVQESPLHTLPLLRDQLVHGMAQAKARREAMLAVDALKDLIIGGSLLPDVRLKYFRDRPLFSSDVTERHLIMWYFEDQLKKLYFEFLQLLEELSKDPLSYVKSKALFYICELLVAKPEQEANLLSLLINKLGDTDGKVASKASFLLVSNVLVKHPAMKLVVVKDIERFLFRSAVGSRARLTALGTLSQIPLSNRDADVAVAGYLVSVYFAFFDILVKGAKTTAAAKHEKFNRQQQEHAAEKKKGKQPTAADIETATISAASAIGGIDARMMASLLTGINRAFPYANLSPSVFAAHMDALFAACHAASSEASFQRQHPGIDSDIPMLAKIYATLTNRFYRVLYDTLTDRRLATATSRLPAYFNLLHRALRADVSDARAKAFTKRILQATVSGMVAGASASFACAALFLIGDLARRRPGIWALVTQPEELSDGKDGGYDPRKREPLFCKAEESCLWELVALSRHYHPTVSLFARTLLSSKPIEAPRSATAYDPLQNHTLARFLDRFVYKNPKQVSAVLHRGSSIMQARPPTAKDEDEDLAYADDEERFVAAGKKKSDYDADKGPRRGRVAEAPGGGDADDVDGDDDAESLDEDEIWEAMQRSVGFPTKGDKEDDDGGDDDDADDDVDLAALAEAMGSDADGDDGDEDAEEADFAADGADNGAEIVDDGDDAWEDDDDEDSFAALDGLDDDDDEDGTGQASAPAPADADAKPRQPPRKLRQLARTAAALGYKGDYFTRRHRAGGDGDDSDDGGGGAGGAAGPFAAMDEFETLIDRADEDEGGGGGGGASGEDDDDGDDGDGLVDFLMDGDDDDDVGGGRRRHRRPRWWCEAQAGCGWTGWRA
ncbi:CBF/Mak21 family-domain-containing protein [Zopfochytrium polystomum]|nr:CBF/Mak21 family-domain-containing protein [Zopfochytrium polystomum]